MRELPGRWSAAVFCLISSFSSSGDEARDDPALQLIPVPFNFTRHLYFTVSLRACEVVPFQSLVLSSLFSIELLSRCRERAQSGSQPPFELDSSAVLPPSIYETIESSFSRSQYPNPPPCPADPFFRPPQVRISRP